MKLIAFDTLGPRVDKNTNDSNFSLYVSLNSSPKVPPPPVRGGAVLRWWRRSSSPVTGHVRAGGVSTLCIPKVKRGHVVSLLSRRAEFVTSTKIRAGWRNKRNERKKTKLPFPNGNYY